MSEVIGTTGNTFSTSVGRGIYMTSGSNMVFRGNTFAAPPSLRERFEDFKTRLEAAISRHAPR
jgi:parallel beta-helix repeat protein